MNLGSADRPLGRGYSVRDVRPDRYGRLLAYVYTEDAESIAEKLVQEGLGWAWSLDGQHRELLVELEDEARKGKSGCLWGQTRLSGVARHATKVRHVNLYLRR